MHGLKIKIVITLIMLLGIGMLLVDYVTVVIWQNELIRCESKAAEANLELLRKIYVDKDLLGLPERTGENFLIRQGIHTVALYKGELSILNAGNGEIEYRELVALAHRVNKNGSRTISFFGEIWGVFFTANEYVAVAEPLPMDTFGEGAVLIVVRSLVPMYQQILKGQRFVFFYIAINIVVFSLIGFYRLLQLGVRPLEKLADIAECYRGEKELSLFSNPGRDELGRLSRGINCMLRRIEENRIELRGNLESLRKTNKELLETRKEMMRAEKMASIGRLSAGLAHEIGNPLAIVQGYHDLLSQDDLSDDERKDFVKNSEKELKRVNILIRQLLDFARSGTATKNKINLHQLLLELSSMLSPQPVMAGITIECCFDADVDAVFGAGDQLWQVFLNCLMNAADAIMEDGEFSKGHIVIFTSNAPVYKDCVLPADKRVLVIIRDNGPGFRLKDTDLVFDPFFTTKQPGKGTGLGLTVSHTIIKNHGGNIYAHSPEDGRGAEIVIELPIYQDDGDVKRIDPSPSHGEMK
ncbi:MAG: ATP-binding protein [Desulfobulbaceae bacterium]|nr:ATP-binding protein [Desulfobulbaceae bacterium]